MWANKYLIDVIKLLWPLVLTVFIGAAAFYQGYLKASRKAETAQAALVAQHQAQALAAEQAYSQALKEAQAEQQKWQAFAQHQSHQLAKATQELDRQQGYLKGEIDHAIKQDNSSGNDCHNGLGAHSVQLYNQAFGYAD